MEERGLNDKRKNVISFFAIFILAVALFFFLFYSTNLFNQNVDNIAQIRKVEKQLEDVNIPEIPEYEIEEKTPNNGENLDVPSIPSIGNYQKIADHTQYTSFAGAEFTINNNVLTTSDKLVYNTGYYSINGAAWTQFTLTGTQYQNYPFLLDGGQANLPNELSTIPGTHFVIVFSCSLTNNGQSWD